MRNLSLFICLALLNLSCTKSVLLRLNYHNSDEYQVSMKLQQTTGGLNGMDMNMLMTMKIAEILKDSVKHETKVERIKLDMSQGGMNISYDSDTGEEELDQIGKKAKEQFEPILNGVIYTTLTRRGELVNTKIVPNVPALEQFGSNSNNLEFPEDKVSVGSSWVQEQNVQGMTTTTTYSVSKIADGKVYLDVDGTVGGIGSGTLKGNGEVDIESGATLKMVLVIDMNVAGTDMKTTTDATMTKIN